jgi:hypothetical protein
MMCVIATFRRQVPSVGEEVKANHTRTAEIARHHPLRLNSDAGSIPAASTSLRFSLEIHAPIDSQAHYTRS